MEAGWDPGAGQALRSSFPRMFFWSGLCWAGRGRLLALWASVLHLPRLPSESTALKLLLTWGDEAGFGVPGPGGLRS